MKKTKVYNFLKILSIVIIAITLTIGTFIYLLFNGNPVERYRTEGRAIDYLARKYPNTKFKVEKTFYNFKDNHYVARVKTEEKTPIEFSVDFDSKNKGNDNYIDKKFSQEINLMIEPKVRKIIKNSKIVIDVFIKEGSNYNENSKFSKEMKDLDILLDIRWEDNKISKQSFAKECVEVVNLLKAEGFNINNYFFSCSDVKSGDFVVSIGKSEDINKVEVSLEGLLKGEDISYFKH